MYCIIINSTARFYVEVKDGDDYRERDECIFACSNPFVRHH